MKIEHAALWDRLRAFDLDDPASMLSFSRRLARENRWGHDEALRVIEEYKRFAFLAIVAGHPVTPSDAVDQAWHLHLVYTRSYWDEFCGQVLCKPLHHGPTRGGSSESAKYHDWYARTLDSYRQHFGTEPPSDLWPEPSVRFGRDLHFARVNTRSHWVVPRPASIARRSFNRLGPIFASVARRGRGCSPGMIATLCLIVTSIVLGGCVAPVGNAGEGVWLGFSSMAGDVFLSIYLPLAVLAAVASVWLRRRLWHHFAEHNPFEDEETVIVDKVNPYEAALLIHGPSREELTRVALVKLVGCGAASFDRPPHGFAAVGPLPAPRHPDPFEEVVLSKIWNGPKRVNQMSNAVGTTQAAKQLVAQLQKCGAVMSPAASRVIRVYPALFLTPVLALGIWRIVLGITRGRPVEFLVFICIALACVCLGHLLKRPWRTARGTRMMEGLRKQVTPADESADPVTAALAFTVLGAAGLPQTAEYLSLQTAFKAPIGDASGCGGDGGGGCGGGGCGGCGGCGG